MDLTPQGPYGACGKKKTRPPEVTNPTLEVNGISKPDILDVLRQEGIEINRNNFATCPLHDDKSPSFKVFPDSQKFHCFGCGTHGDVIDFIMQYRGISFKESLAYLGIEGKPTPEMLERRARSGRKKELRTHLEEWRRKYINALIDRLRELERLDAASRGDPTKEGAEPWDRVELTSEIPQLEWKIELLQSGDLATIIDIYEDFVR